MSTRRTVTLHHVITIYNNTFNYFDGIAWVLLKKKTQWKDDLNFILNFAHQQWSNDHFEVIPKSGILLIVVHILDPFWKSWSYRKWDNIIDVNPQDDCFFTVQYKDVFLQYVEHEYCFKDCKMYNLKLEIPNHNDPFSTSPDSGSRYWFYDPYDLSSDDTEYITSANIIESTPRCSHCPPWPLPAPIQYLNYPPEVLRRWGQNNPISMIITPMLWKYEVPTGFLMWQTGGNIWIYWIWSTLILPMWQMI
jgi:hypothetical protein